MSNLTDPIDPTFARSFVAGMSTEELAPEVLDVLTGELLKERRSAVEQTKAIVGVSWPDYWGRGGDPS